LFLLGGFIFEKYLLENTFFLKSQSCFGFFVKKSSEPFFSKMKFLDGNACVVIDGYEVSARVSTENLSADEDHFQYLVDLAQAWSPRSLFLTKPTLLRDCTDIVELDETDMTITAADVNGTVTINCKTKTGSGYCVAKQPFQSPTQFLSILAIVLSVPIPRVAARAHCVIGIMPWVYADKTSEILGGVQIGRLVRNVDYVDASTQEVIRPLLHPVPFPGLVVDSDDLNCRLSARSVLSFALMWHMARTHSRNKKDGHQMDYVLDKRSFRYFFRECPRKALLGSRNGFLALRNTAALLSRKTTVNFFSAQFADVTRYVLMQTRGNKLARIEILRDCVAAFSEFLEAVPNPRTAWLHQSVQSYCYVGLVADSSLPEDMIEWLGGDSLCMSFDVCGMLSEFLGTFNPEMFIYQGRVYITDEAQQERVARELMRFYLQKISGSSSVSSAVDWDDLFESAMPVEEFVYANQRNTTLDDCSLHSELMRLVRDKIDATEFRNFQKETGDAIKLPDDFNCAVLYKITQSDAVTKSRETNIDPAALRAATLAVSRTRRHVTIEYDKETRAETQTQMDVDTRGTGDPDAIEDIVYQIMDNRALPLCAVQFAARIKRGGPHLQNEHRKVYYRILNSLQVPELSHEAILRHILSAVHDRDKLAEQQKDMNRFPLMTQKMHERAADGHQRSFLEHSSSEVSREKALARTTSAPSCETMIKDERNLHLCPFTWRSVELIQELLESAGIDHERASMIAAGARDRDPRELCQVHLLAATTMSIREHMHPQLTKMAEGKKHPRDFTHVVALANLFRAESKQNGEQ
jgi:hypothetical protein